MSPRKSVPRTGHAPNVSVRVSPEAMYRAKVAAVTARKTLGQWLEEAINEKLEREKRGTTDGIDT